MKCRAFTLNYIIYFEWDCLKFKLKKPHKHKEEACKKEQEEVKRKENEMVFRAWLEKKKGQMQEERRIQRAKELEDLNSRVS